MHSHVWYSIFAVFVVQSNKESVAGSVVDLGHGYTNRMSMCWAPDKRFDIFDVERGTGPNGLYTTESFSTPEHCGTHLDAPFHFNPDGWKLNDIPLERLVVEGEQLLFYQ